MELALLLVAAALEGASGAASLAALALLPATSVVAPTTLPVIARRRP